MQSREHRTQGANRKTAMRKLASALETEIDAREPPRTTDASSRLRTPKTLVHPLAVPAGERRSHAQENRRAKAVLEGGPELDEIAQP